MRNSLVNMVIPAPLSASHMSLNSWRGSVGSRKDSGLIPNGTATACMRKIRSVSRGSGAAGAGAPAGAGAGVVMVMLGNAVRNCDC